MASEAIATTQRELSAQSIESKLHTHAAVMNVDEHQAAAGSLECVLAKNLLFKSKKNKFYLIVAPHDRKVDSKKLAKDLKETGGVRFADEKALEEKLGVTKGSVTPLGVINDKAKEVEYIFDAAFTDDSKIGVHPLTNEATLVMRVGDLKKFIESKGCKVKSMDLEAGAGAPAAAGGEGGEQKQSTEKPKKAPAAAAAAASTDDSSKTDDKVADLERGTSLGITAKKNTSFGAWYAQTVIRSEMIEYYDISGCYILRPWSFSIWESIQSFFDTRIKRLGVKNTYFPLFVSRKALCAEEDHIEGFAPEVAWVTKSGQSDLVEPIAVRPTSETIMYPAFAKWIRSHRDLPLRINQWSNVVRWEFKNPTPFIRTREFLWQEGHSAFATLAEAEIEVLQILELYASVYTDLLAIPVIKGKKTEKEKFAGGLYTTTVEVFVPSTGRGCQGATSHCLGQNFAHMFDIQFETDQKTKAYAWQNSWGLTTRTIGVLIMVHGDDKGLVLPPRVAPLQVIIVPIYFRDKEGLKQRCREIKAELESVGVRADTDLRENYNPGWKYNQWEMKGVPIRIEVGPKDIEAKRVVVARRDNGVKANIANGDIAQQIPELLRDIQRSMLAKATADRDARLVKARTWHDFMTALQNRNLVQAPWCGESKCEEIIKTRTAEESAAWEEKTVEAATEADGGEAEGKEAFEKLTGAAKSLCVPFNQPHLPSDAVCVNGCGKKAINWTMFGRSY